MNIPTHRRTRDIGNLQTDRCGGREHRAKNPATDRKGNFTVCDGYGDNDET